ncbi:MAG: hypothetical protein M3P26_14545 [Gemmatimonadota bacterium]|nr:hypothetical protein [Gemmatimonadota bacterium]
MTAASNLPSLREHRPPDRFLSRLLEPPNGLVFERPKQLELRKWVSRRQIDVVMPVVLIEPIGRGSMHSDSLSILIAAFPSDWDFAVMIYIDGDEVHSRHTYGYKWVDSGSKKGRRGTGVASRIRPRSQAKLSRSRGYVP